MRESFLGVVVDPVHRWEAGASLQLESFVCTTRAILTVVKSRLAGVVRQQQWNDTYMGGRALSTMCLHGMCSESINTIVQPAGAEECFNL